MTTRDLRGAGGGLADRCPRGGWGRLGPAITGVGHRVRLKLTFSLWLLIGVILGYTISGWNDLPPDSGTLAPEITVPAQMTPIPPPALPPTPDHNAIYRADLQVPAVTCVLPAMGTTNRQLEAWVQASVICLDNAWQPVLVTAGLPFSRPGIRRFSGNIPDRACLDVTATAYYCPADKVISVSPDRELNPIPVAHRTGWLLMTMAHEYGHHIQELSGITEAGDRTQADHPYRSPAWLQLNRRMELQANCFAGVGIAAMSGRGSVGAGELADAASGSSGGDDAQPGLPRDHGTMANNLKWFQTGLDAGRPAVCNTWLAATGKVA
ncbi:MAG: neutral zinc metallopeptidase [Pseudonocardiaceae bacterium]